MAGSLSARRLKIDPRKLKKHVGAQLPQKQAFFGTRAGFS